MSNNARFAEIAALDVYPVRASMLNGLMDGRALTASELAQLAGVTAQTASSHLTRMTEAGLLAVEKQGRHRYHRLASPAVSQMIESIMRLAAPEITAKPVRTGPRDAALRAGRTCYDHLAGHLGVSMTDALIDAGHLALYSAATRAPEPATTDLSTVERDMIARVLTEVRWNKAKAARRLGLSRTQLYYRIRRYGLE